MCEISDNTKVEKRREDAKSFSEEVHSLAENLNTVLQDCQRLKSSNRDPDMEVCDFSSILAGYREIIVCFPYHWLPIFSFPLCHLQIDLYARIAASYSTNPGLRVTWLEGASKVCLYSIIFVSPNFCQSGFLS